MASRETQQEPNALRTAGKSGAQAPDTVAAQAKESCELSFSRSVQRASQTEAARRIGFRHGTPTVQEERLESSDDCRSTSDCSGNHRICGRRLQLHAREERHRYGTDSGAAQADENRSHFADPQRNRPRGRDRIGGRGLAGQSLGRAQKTFRNARFFPGPRSRRHPASALPAKQSRPYREACADACDQHKVAFLQLALFARRLHGQRNRPGGGVAEAIDVDDHLFLGQA